MSKNKRKAFTLTELLVVVVVIGVLAAVVLPKYTKVIETRKTTEAENMMAAVRTEQEHRCALDKQYINIVDKLVNAKILSGKTTKNFHYALLPEGTGMEAQSLGRYHYTLQMPSYSDGRICCSGAGCSKLNKEYPACEELKAQTDYRQSPASCINKDLVQECTGSAVEQCGCNNEGTKTRNCNHQTGEWSEWSACSIAEECPQEDDENAILCDEWKDEGGSSRDAICEGNSQVFDAFKYTKKNATKSEFISACCLSCSHQGSGQISTSGAFINRSTGETWCCDYSHGEKLVWDKGSLSCKSACENGQEMVVATSKQVPIEPLNNENIYQCGGWHGVPVQLTAVVDLGVFADYDSVKTHNKNKDDPNGCRQFFIGRNPAERTDLCTSDSVDAWCNDECKGSTSCDKVCYLEAPDWGNATQTNVKLEYASSLSADGTSYSTREATFSFQIPAGYDFVGWNADPSVTKKLGGQEITHSTKLTPQCTGGCTTRASFYCDASYGTGCGDETSLYNLSADYYEFGTAYGMTMTSNQANMCLLRRRNENFSGYACVHHNETYRSSSACGLSSDLCYVD